MSEPEALLPIEPIEPQLLWLSFADKTGFLGVIITEELDFMSAIHATHALGINPGGEVRGYEIEKDNLKPEDYDILLSQETLTEKGYIPR